MYSLSGMASMSASVSCSKGLVFQWSASEESWAAVLGAVVDMMASMEWEWKTAAAAALPAGQSARGGELSRFKTVLLDALAGGPGVGLDRRRATPAALTLIFLTG